MKIGIIGACLILVIIVVLLWKGKPKEEVLQEPRSEETVQGELPDSVILISTAEELAKIGKSKDYPMDGDYALDADIDLSKVAWDPIGADVGIKGETTGSHVFSGTFNGQGHVISGLNIKREGNIVPNTNYAKVGLFGVIASQESVDYAEICNVIFTDVNIFTDYTDGVATVGTLAGEVNGYVKIDNVAVVNGTLQVNPSARCDTVGAGGLIGECRTENGVIGNKFITITNIYNGANVIASGTRNDLVYTGGIIGRIAKTPCKEVAQCVNTGMITYQGGAAYAIAGTEGHSVDFVYGMKNCYYLNGSGKSIFTEAIAYSETVLKSGKLQVGLDENLWVAKENNYIMLKSCYESKIAGMLSLMSMDLEFADGENADEVKSDITLPEKVGENKIVWTSSDESVLKPDGNKALAYGDSISENTRVTLTATLEDGFSKDFSIMVVASNPVKIVFKPAYPQVGVPFTAELDGHEGGDYSYQWMSEGKTLAANGATYTPQASDMEHLISVKITDNVSKKEWESKVYCSQLPVVYVDTEDGGAIVSNVNAKNAYIRIQGNGEFTDAATYYEGATTIKGRGNSTWTEAVNWNVKKPYKLKLDTKANLLGLSEGGENKHWVLLSNIIDHTNMRNELMSMFSEALGMKYTVATTNVVLVLNGKYEGVYQLAEHVRIDESRVNVFDWEDTAEDIAKAVCEKNESIKKKELENYLKENLSWIDTGEFTYGTATYKIADYYTEELPEGNGGFLLDMDFRSFWDTAKYVSTFVTGNGVPMFFRNPEYAVTSDTLVKYATDYLNAYEAALRSHNFSTVYQNRNTHYSELFDMDSLVQNWFVCEYSNNWDSMKNSTYLYKDIDELAIMGPAWDFDWAFGNINMYNNTLPFVTDQWHTTLSRTPMEQGGFLEQTYQAYQWNTYLVQDPYFVTKVYEYYQKLRPTFMEDVIKDGGIIDTLEKKYETASLANDDKWSYSYKNCNGYAYVNGVKTFTQSQNYTQAVESLKTFITKRTEWFDSQFTSVEALYESLGNKVSDKIKIAVSVEGAQTVITATINDNNAGYAEFVVNGKTQNRGTSKGVALSGNQVQIRVATDTLIQDGLNTVQVFSLDGNGNLISGEKNFVNFTLK